VRRSDAVFERFTEHARTVVILGQEEARTLGHQYIGTEHILLGLLRDEEGLAARILESLDITAERVRAQVRRIVVPGEDVMFGQIPFTPRAKKVLQLALREALSLGHDYIDTEHILLAIVRESDGVAARILLDFDVDSERIRDEVLRLHPDAPRRAQMAIEADVELPIRVGASPRLRPLLLAAAGRALSAKRTEIEPVDLLHALASDPSITAVIGELGLEAGALRQAVERHAPDA
jgi:Clp amino terminal domain, pathogenicity island component